MVPWAFLSLNISILACMLSEGRRGVLGCGEMYSYLIPDHYYYFLVTKKKKKRETHSNMNWGDLKVND